VASTVVPIILAGGLSNIEYFELAGHIQTISPHSSLAIAVILPPRAYAPDISLDLIVKGDVYAVDRSRLIDAAGTGNFNSWNCSPCC